MFHDQAFAITDIVEGQLKVECLSSKISIPIVIIFEFLGLALNNTSPVAQVKEDDLCSDKNFALVSAYIKALGDQPMATVKEHSASWIPLCA